MRILNHPFLEKESTEVNFCFERKNYKGYAHQSIAAALIMNGIYDIAHSKTNQPRGMYSYDARTETCYVIVNETERVLATETLVQEGMCIEKSEVKPNLRRTK